MVDNFTTDAGAGGDTFGADDIGGVKFPRVKLIVGADGSNDGDVASGNPLPITATALTTLASAIKAEDAASAGGDAGIVVVGMRQDTPAAVSGTDGDYEPLRIKGGLLVVDASLTTLTVASHAVTNAGTFVVQDSEKVADDAAFTVGTTKVQPVGFFADEASTDSVNEGDIGAARMTLDRKLVTAPHAHTQGGALAFKSLDLDETEEDVKTSAGQVYGFIATNRRTSPLFLKFYNDTAANVIVGTTAPVITIEIPANSTDHTAMIANFPVGVQFDTAICVAATTGFADADTGAPGANELIISVFYK